MIGPPCSGKTTKARKMLKEVNHGDVLRFNRDELRKMMLGFVDTNNGFVEQSINELTKYTVHRCVYANMDLIVDATHCKPSYINQIKNLVPAGMLVNYNYVICDVPYWKQRWRNFWRWAGGGGWIPRDVSKNMERNFRNTLELIKADKV